MSLAATYAVSALFMRHLGGFVLEGSPLTEVRDPLVYVVPWLTTTALAVAVTLLVRTRRRPWLPVLSVAVAVGALFQEWALVIHPADSMLAWVTAAVFLVLALAVSSGAGRFPPPVRAYG
ncbi:hypothetical protein [Streptomyces uncialis]|uniref:hypothetical protein n=1 Tax=Streptomyces uncialis TaxID=1048205 RepID=UPI0033C182F8